MARAVLALLDAAEHEGFTICALAHCRILFVSTNADLLESAIAFTGVVCALHNSAGDTMVVLLFHFDNLPFIKPTFD